MATLNNIVAKIAEFQTNHKQLKSWFFGPPPDEKVGGNSIRYPMLMGILQPNKISINSDVTVIEFYVLDKVKKDKRNETEVFSDTKLICIDLVTYLKQTKWNDFLSVNTDITLNDIVDAGADEVSGWSFQLELRGKIDWDLCSVPITGAPIQPNLNMLNSLENYTIAGSSQTILHTPVTGGMYLSFLEGGYLIEGRSFVRSGTTITFYQDYTISTTPLDCTGLKLTVAYQY